MLFVYLALLPSLLAHLIILIALLPPSSSAFVVPLGRVAVSSSSSQRSSRHTALRAESEQAVDFDEAVELVNGQGTPLLVDFFARWWATCVLLACIVLW